MKEKKNDKNSMSHDETEKIFLKKMKEAEEMIDRREYMTSKQVHTILNV